MGCKKFHSFTGEEVKILNLKLLNWFLVNKRVLPWRNLDSLNLQQKAYCVLVSEIMLQQTQVNSVMPYYKRWIIGWPTLRALSEASLEDVQQAWKGLGYYSRGRRLLQLAQKVMKESCQLPETVNGLLELPGIGRYTAGAVASIAFGLRVAAVDGNVQRVLCRLRAIGGIVDSRDVMKYVWELAESLVPDSEPGEWNQALMELGATVCTPRKPSCHACPLRDHCHAFNLRSHDVEDCHLCLTVNDGKPSPLDFPQKAQKRKARVEREVTCIVTAPSSCGTKYFMIKRDSNGLLADLWQFPSFPTSVSDGLKLSRNAGTQLRKYCGNIGKTCSKYLGSVAHKFSHINMTYEIIHLEISQEKKLRPPPGCLDAQWFSSDELQTRPISTAMRKVIKKLNEQEPSA